ncbi:MAG: hypothetical protein NVSMB66_4850 [Candidatus Doudnabacteria bacterium]
MQVTLGRQVFGIEESDLRQHVDAIRKEGVAVDITRFEKIKNAVRRVRDQRPESNVTTPFILGSIDVTTEEYFDWYKTYDKIQHEIIDRSANPGRADTHERAHTIH